MPPVPADAFAREFRALSATDRTAFVAALWNARGWETTVEGDIIIADQDDERRRIRVVDPGRFGTPNMDGFDTLVAARDREAVQASASEAGIEYVCPNELYDLLLYGIDRETACDLYGAWFNQSLERAPGDDESEEKEGNALGALQAAVPSLSENHRAVATLLLVALVGVAVAGPALPGGGAPDQIPVTVSDATPDDENAGAIGGASPSPTPVPGVMPGVTREGVVDPGALTTAHVEGVSNRSRVRSMSISGPPNSSLMGGTTQRNMTTRIQNDSRYRQRTMSLMVGNESEWRAGLDVYASGGEVFQRLLSGDDARYSRFTAEERPARQYDTVVEAYLYRYFAGANNTVVRCTIDYDSDCPTYRIEVDDNPPAVLGSDIEDYEALAIVSENGVITTIRASYTLPDDGGDGERERVSFALDYQFEEVDPSAPPWLSEARNATGTPTANETATPTPTG